MDDHDELDYNITFPTPTGAEDPDMKEPVVYLLGWAGATDKLLSKYSAIYETEGCITLRCTLPVDDVLLSTSSTVLTLQDTSRKLLQLLDDYELRQSPIMFHVFSNAGATLYRWSSEAFLKEKIDIVGVVMDSCPSRHTLAGGLKATYYSQRPKGFCHFLLYLGRFLLSHLRNLVTFSWDSKMDPFDALKSSRANAWPHLFLYSSSDALVPSKAILEMAEGRKAAGVNYVRTHDFKNSVHVSHFRTYKELYTEECGQFLCDCLKIYDGESVAASDVKQTSSVDPVKARPFSAAGPSTSGRRTSARLRRTSLE